MDDADLKRRVKGLQAILERDYGIKTRAELLEAMKGMKPIDISFAVIPLRPDDFLCPDATKTEFETA